jgi:hypothetical protein
MACNVLTMILPLLLGGGSVGFFLQRKRQQDLANIENLQMDIQKQREASSKIKMFSENDFKIYSGLWIRLTDLETSIHELWTQGLTKRGLHRLMNAVEHTELMLRDSSVLLDQPDLAELNRILATLKNFRVDGNDGISGQIQRQIQNNVALVTYYAKLKISIFRKIRKKAAFSETT